MKKVIRDFERRERLRKRKREKMGKTMGARWEEEGKVEVEK